MKRALVTTAFVSILVLGSCAGPEQSDVEGAPPTEATIDSVVATALERANDDPRTEPSQLEAIERALAEDGVTLAVMREATEDMNACLLEAGLTTQGVTTQSQSGFEFPLVHGIQSPDDLSEDQVMALINDCDARFVSHLSYVYSQQPSAQDNYWNEARHHEPRIRECLLEAGVPEDEIGDTIQEVINTAVDILYPDPEVNPYGFHDCMDPLDLPLWD